MARMSETPASRKQVQWAYLAAVATVTGLLWLADGRLWPSTAAYARDGFWLVMMAQLILGSWLHKSRPGRVFAALLDAVFFWVGAQWAWDGVVASGPRRWIVLVGGGLVLALIFASVAWERFPVAWRARLADSRIARALAVGAIVAMVGGFLWAAIAATSIGEAPPVAWGLLAVLLAVAGGMALALWRLTGWRRVTGCWAILGLAWIGLMTGLATGVPSGAVKPGGWLLALVPPVIAGGVLAAYWRVERRFSKGG